MTKLKKIEDDVESLSPEELAAFRKWFQAYDAANWDRQLERDVRDGKLERLRQEATAEHKDHRTRERPTFGTAMIGFPNRFET